jgi:hypothetical protein
MLSQRTKHTLTHPRQSVMAVGMIFLFAAFRAFSGLGRRLWGQRTHWWLGHPYSHDQRSAHGTWWRGLIPLSFRSGCSPKTTSLTRVLDHYGKHAYAAEHLLLFCKPDARILDVGSVGFCSLFRFIHHHEATHRRAVLSVNISFFCSLSFKAHRHFIHPYCREIINYGDKRICWCV